MALGKSWVRSAELLKLVAQDRDLHVFDVLVIRHNQARTRRRSKATRDRIMGILPLV
jgi:hypothetical protein